MTRCSLRTTQAWLLASLALAAGCDLADPLTQIVVVIDADSDEWERVEVRVDGFTKPREVDVDDLDRKPLPRRFAIVHDGGPLGPIAVVVRAFRPGEDVPALVEPRTGMEFVRRETRLLHVVLRHACIGACAQGEACLAGAECVPSDEAAMLAPWTGEAPAGVGGADAGSAGEGGSGAGATGGGVGGASGAGGAGGAGGDPGKAASAWGYQPANFDPVTLAKRVAPNEDVVLDCGDSEFDSGTLAFENFCGVKPGVEVVQQTPGTDAVVLVMRSLRIAQGANLVLRGVRPVILAVYGDADIAGFVDASGKTGLDGPGASRGCAEGVGSSGGAPTDDANGAGGGSGGAFGSPGGRGGAVRAGGVRVDGGLVQGAPELVPLRGGCPGGKGGAASEASVVGFGGGGGGAVQISASGEIAIDGGVSAAGGGGGVGSEPRDGGGGGGSGGAIVLEGRPVTFGTGATIVANGGGGGGGQAHKAPTSAHPGQAGARTSLGAAAGGTGTAPGGDGGAGATRVAHAVDGADPTAAAFIYSGGGGGGGGGVGRIRVNGAEACIPIGNFSPVPFVVCPDCGACPVAPAFGCVPQRRDDGQYFACSVGAPWKDANAACAAGGMHLVRIDTEKEDAWLHDLVDTNAWIGATDEAVEGAWRWTDDGDPFWMGGVAGSVVDDRYVNWAVGQPNDVFSVEDCARLDPTGWSDASCADQEAYVCER